MSFWKKQQSHFNWRGKLKKKLIEVALPLEAINEASSKEKSIRQGHPSTLHLWWARRPLAAARAIIFSQMVDDPSSYPDLFPTEKSQEKERKRLFKIIEEFVKWENTNNEVVLEKARAEIWESWRRTCTENAENPKAKELFNRNKLPVFHDPFSGGGALPLEAQRLGMESYASDLNPVAVMINKAMIEIPFRFGDKLPVNPEMRKNSVLLNSGWKGAHGIAEDVLYYGNWMISESKKRIGNYYPEIEITKSITKDRLDLKQYEGKRLKVIAWLWARTIKSPNPAFSDVDVPLISTYILSKKKGKEAFLKPVVSGKKYKFDIVVDGNANSRDVEIGTKASGSGSSFLCLMSREPIPFEYIRNEAKAGKMGIRLMAIVAEGKHGRVYLPPIESHEEIALSAAPENIPDSELPKKALGFRIQEYGMSKWKDLFSRRQLLGLSTLSDLVQEVKEQVRTDAVNSGMKDDREGLDANGNGAMAYAETIAIYLALGVDKAADYNSTICCWISGGETLRSTFGRQAIPMVWDFCEANILGDSTGSYYSILEQINRVVRTLGSKTKSYAYQQDAQTDQFDNAVVSTDPPYFDNIGYADLSDFFYVWLRRSIKTIYPKIFATISVPKVEELIATRFRHKSQDAAETFFLNGMTHAMHRIAMQSHPSFPTTIYYAFKQAESENQLGTASTGWETFLGAVINAGFTITGTWPVRTERESRSVGIGTNALASSIVLVCRPISADAPNCTRREFITVLKKELPIAIAHLQHSNTAPVDLAQAAIGPGMAVFTRYSKVIDAQGKPLSVRDSLRLINQTLDEVLAEQEGDFDADSRWALAWFEQQGFKEGEYGLAEMLSKAKNTSVNGLVEAGILESSRGKVRLLTPKELPIGWDPLKDKRLTEWEALHHLIRVLEDGGESAAAEIVKKLGSKSEIVKELAYRLYSICEHKRRSVEALSYNALIQSWQEIVRLSGEINNTQLEPGTLF